MFTVFKSIEEDLYSAVCFKTFLSISNGVSRIGLIYGSSLFQKDPLEGVNNERELHHIISPGYNFYLSFEELKYKFLRINKKSIHHLLEYQMDNLLVYSLENKTLYNRYGSGSKENEIYNKFYDLLFNEMYNKKSSTLELF